MTPEARVRAFFTEYEARSNRALMDPPVVDPADTVAAFADYVVEASPRGVTGFKNDQEFKAVIPQGYAFYRSIGTKSMTIRTLKLTQLDPLHWSARVHWDSTYIKKDGAKVQIDFQVIYLVQMLKTTPEIFAYISGDEQKALLANGLLDGSY